MLCLTDDHLATMAGGGLRPGWIYGCQTGDFGYQPVVGRVGVPDMMAMVLHQLGLDHRKTANTLRFS